jgi:alpha,alpha-trehalase
MHTELISDYIRQNWSKTLRTGNGGRADILPLPYPYTVPCIDGEFQAFFYWDTYFTNVGLLLHGLVDVAKANVENMFHLIDTFGYVPNQTFVGQTNRSQPPYLSLMVREIYDRTHDQDWLARAHGFVEREYAFWMKDRITPIGLNRHYHDADDSFLARFFDEAVAVRLPYRARNLAEKIAMGGHYLAEAETGWDFNPRFGGRCADFTPVDLNSNLYAYEENFAYFSAELGRGDDDAWSERAATRQRLMNRYLWDEGAELFLDYDYVNSRRSDVPSLAAYHSLWAGLATDAQAAKADRKLGLFERERGVAVCPRVERPVRFQWDFPNMWPPLALTTATGLARYGHTASAGRIARKLCVSVEENFRRSGRLWEKYEVTGGGVASGEYPAQDMLGWTAGAYLALSELAAV